MKKLIRIASAFLFVLNLSNAVAQEGQEITIENPEIQMLIEEYQLNKGQSLKVVELYNNAAEQSASLNKAMKDSQLHQKETLKSATPDEKAKMKLGMDGLAKRRQAIIAERDKAFVSLLDEEQQAIYAEKQKEGKMKKSTKEEMMEKEKTEMKVKSAK